VGKARLHIATYFDYNFGITILMLVGWVLETRRKMLVLHNHLLGLIEAQADVINGDVKVSLQ
jgi:hypothetical protein